jgi:D-tagatose-1,6-bisphosphate aldolase subunit GatZ/KbaZ
MKALLDLVARHKGGQAIGITSVCSAHPLVIAATFAQALLRNTPLVLIEATSNQVNQDGGYTGMVPAAFRDFVYSIADETGYPKNRIVLGGDHLGPNVWTSLSADEAMANADVMIDLYVRAGFRKIHLDCSMSCADDSFPLADERIAERAARLCAVAERAHTASGGEPPVYVIGTEVPVPGGAAEDLETLQVTSPAAARETIDLHRRIFAAHGLASAWPRVIATVVQPGVEFDHHKVIDYDRDKAAALSRSIAEDPQFVFEAHSTDYQTPVALAQLVEDHFAILKVGPGVTFALREALWALAAIEQEIVPREQRSGFRAVVLGRMRDHPQHWAKYYETSGAALELDLQYSLSDRIRYYWPDPVIVAAQDILFDNLASTPPSLPLVSQYLPLAYAAVRAGTADLTPKGLVMAHIAAVLDNYHQACTSHG